MAHRVVLVRTALVAGALILGGGPPGTASAAAPLEPGLAAYLPPPWGLSGDERASLLGGWSVQRPVAFRHGDGRYVGGVVYQTVRAPADQVLAALGTPAALAHALPRTKSAELVAEGPRTRHVELVQGNAVVEARYTVRIEPGRPGELRFWLDRGRPHDIDDVWGFFRVQPFGPERSLLTVAVALDLGPGVARMLFERKVQAVILDAPRHIRDHVEASRLDRAPRTWASR